MEVKFNSYEDKDIIRMIREASELTQEEFGKKIGKSRRTVQEYERGTATYNIKVFRKILEEFGFEVQIKSKYKR